MPCMILGTLELGCKIVGGMHRYARANFKLNRAADLAEWRQLLSA